MTKVKFNEENLLKFSDELKAKKIEIPVYLKEIIIMALKIVKIFTNEKIDLIIDEIIKLLQEI